MTSNRLFFMKAGDFQDGDKAKLLISYQTIIGYIDTDGAPVFTDNYARSASTNQHKAKFRQIYGPGRVTRAGEFASSVRRLGYNAGFNKAPVSFS